MKYKQSTHTYSEPWWMARGLGGRATDGERGRRDGTAGQLVSWLVANSKMYLAKNLRFPREGIGMCEFYYYYFSLCTPLEIVYRICKSRRIPIPNIVKYM